MPTTVVPAAPDIEAAIALKSEILTLVRRYEAAAGAEGHAGTVGLAGLVESLLDAYFGDGRYAERFEDSLTRLFGAREALLVNSGTSANLVAVSSLTSPRLGKLRLTPGDEVVTVGAGSPSLVAALVQNQLVPVFVDLALPAFNVDVRQLQAALSSRTRAIALAHLHGSPFDLDAVTLFAAFNNLLLVEDCRDAAGSSFSGRPAGCFGQFATASFHAGRQLSTGEGGAVMASTPLYRSIAASFRDGGRNGASGALAHAGHNLRATEMQAALGAAQTEGFPARVEKRNHNAKLILDGLAGLAEYLVLPESHPTARPSWLELPLVVREGAPFDRNRLVAGLACAGVAARPFSPSLPTHPAFQSRAHRLCGSLRVTNQVTGNGLLLRVPPGGGQADPATVIEAAQSIVRDLR